jgi:drug/metabolite transporter (DMT)-like permease
MTIGKGEIPVTVEIVFPLVHGGAILTLGLLLFNRASRLVAPLTLIVVAQTETVFAPLWRWLILGELPGAATATGGLVIVLAVIAAGVMSARERPIAVRETSSEGVDDANG